MKLYFKLIYTISVFTIITSCDNLKDEDKSIDNLYTSDIIHDFNELLQGYSQNRIDGYYLEDSLRGNDSIRDIQFHFAALLYFKKKTIDSLYETLPRVFWLDKDNLDTMIYMNSLNVISPSEKINEKTLADINEIIKILEKIQPELIKIKDQVEKLRPGTKNEKINCQNCKSMASSKSILNIKNMSALYLETEKQFMIVYRELACSSFSIELVNVRKVALKSYKVRI